MSYGCEKRCHRSPAAARKWLRKSGRRTDAKHLYQCDQHDGQLVYHFTRLAQREHHPVPGDLRLQFLADFARKT